MWSRDAPRAHHDRPSDRDADNNNITGGKNTPHPFAMRLSGTLELWCVIFESVLKTPPKFWFELKNFRAALAGPATICIMVLRECPLTSR
jgi:hypothetical protein